MLHSMRGVLVGAEVREYKQWTNKETGEVRPARQAYVLHISQSFDSAPVQVNCERQEFDQASVLGSGAKVECMTRIGAYKDTLQVRLVSLASASENGVRAGK